jgi:uncharacterized membrane protein
MTTSGHLWAVGYDNIERAEQVRGEITDLAWGNGRTGNYLLLYDIAVIVRHLDGSFKFDRQPVPGIANILACSAVGLLVGMVLAAPLAGAALGAVFGAVGTVAVATTIGISGDFVREVKRQMQPGTSALFILDDAGDLEVIRHAIRGLGGRLLKTNVQPERARLIQSSLAQPVLEQT